MKKYKINLSQKVVQWDNYYYEVLAETPEEAVKIAEDEANDEGKGYTGSSNEQSLTPEENYLLTEKQECCEGETDMTKYVTYEVQCEEIEEFNLNKV